MKKGLAIVMALAITAVPITPTWADDISELKEMIVEMRSDYEDRIAQLEAKIDSLESTQKKEVSQLASEIKENTMSIEYVGRNQGDVGPGGLLVHGPGESSVTLGGYADMEFEKFENNDSTFDQHRFVLAIGAQVGERLSFFSETEIEHGGPDAAGSGSLKVEAAHLDYMINDAANVRFGAVLVPFGRYNIYHDSDLNNLTDRPLMARRIVPTTWTESGVGLHGAFDLTEDIEMTYETYVINGLNTSISDRGFRDGTGSLKSDNNNEKSLVSRVTLSPWIGTELGLSGYTGDYNDSGDSIQGGAIDFITNVGPFELITEYAHFDVDDNNGVDVADELSGGYVQLNYDFWPEFLDDTFLGRDFDNPKFALVTRYGWAEVDDDADAGTGDNEEERYTLGFNYRPTDNFVWKLEYQWNDTENEALERGSNDGFITSFAMGF